MTLVYKVGFERASGSRLTVVLPARNATVTGNSVSKEHGDDHDEVLPVHSRQIRTVGVAGAAKRILIALVTASTRGSRGAMVIAAATCVSSAVGLGSSSVSVPSQGRPISTTIRSVTHVLADLRYVLVGIRVGCANPYDGFWIGAVGGLSDSIGFWNA